MKNKPKSPKAEELEGKIQVTDQESASNDSNNVKGFASKGTEIKEVDEPKAAINTKQAAEVVAAGTNSFGGGALSSRGSATSFSGGAGNTRGDESATTRETNVYKGGTRAGRRADPITKKIDYLDAEAFKTHIRQSKPLAETSEKQGYNGNYLNEHAITQRCSGGVPGDPLFERSVDSIEFDMLYYTLGQLVSSKQQGEHLSIRNWNTSLNNGNGGYDPATSIDLDDYLLQSIDVTFDVNGNITNFVPNRAILGPRGVDERCARASADTVRRFFNISELDRNSMISIAGNESDPSWSCLGDGIVDATDQNRLLRLIDSLAGNIVGTSARKLKTAGAFQVNKTAKDGARRTGPMAEMFNGCIPTFAGATHSVNEDQGIYQALYSSQNMLAGGCGLWLAVNDSLPKFNTKGKLLSLPNGPKLALAAAKSNMDPLLADNQLFALMKSNELFSTIDGPYDPLKPIVITDKIGLIHPIDPFVGCTFADGQLNTNIYTMHVSNLRNNYNVNIRNFFAEGLFEWFRNYASRIVDHLKKCIRDEDPSHPWNSGTQTVHIPVVSSTTTFSLWDLIVCQATPFIAEARTKVMTELLKYEKNHGYPYSNVSHLKDIDIDACDNYSIGEIDAPISSGIAKPIAAMKVIMPELFWPVAKVNAQGELGHNGVGAKVVLPHYFVQNQFQYDQMNSRETMRLLLSDEYATMAYPSTRTGSNFSFMDTVYGMSEEDYRLSLDRMTVYPGYEGKYNDYSKIMRTRGAGSQPKYEAVTYKYGLSSDGLVTIPYFAYANDAAHKDETLQVIDIVSTPRELGLMQVAPAGLLTPIRVLADTENLVALDSSYLGLSGPGFRIRLYHAIGVNPENTILNQGTVNINNNASLEYVYDVISCNRYGCLNFNDGLAFNASSGRAILAPFTAGAYNPQYGNYDPQTGEYTIGETQDAALRMHTHQRYNWNRIQRLPFVVNPFDCNVDPITTSTDTLACINDEDIFDFLYMFGFCGFRASDYSELVNLRVKERIAKGMNYVTDPFVDKSLLLK